jgi:hypothetical protein
LDDSGNPAVAPHADKSRKPPIAESRRDPPTRRCAQDAFERQLPIQLTTHGGQLLKPRKPRSKPKKIAIIARPNGVGKTTFAYEFLLNEPDCPDFINADLIARGLSPFAPAKAALQAGKIMLNQITAFVDAGKSFAFETTLSGLNYARHIPRWQAAGYHVKLFSCVCHRWICPSPGLGPEYPRAVTRSPSQSFVGDLTQGCGI